MTPLSPPMRRYLSKLTETLCNPSFPIRAGFSSVHLSDWPSTWAWWRRLRFQKDFVIEVRYPGLGDHLFYSILPELLIRHGLAQRVWLSSHSPMRYPEIKSLLWEPNPYLSGVSPKRGWYNSGLRPKDGNFLDGLVFQFTGGVPPATSTLPRVYGQPKRERGRGYWLLDFGRIANRHRIDVRRLAEDLEKREAQMPRVLCYESDFAESLLRCAPALEAKRQQGEWEWCPREASLGDYFQRVREADRWVGFYSGGAVLAAAFHVPAITYCEFYDPAISFNSAEYVPVG